jgi:hypothetical protein
VSIDFRIIKRRLLADPKVQAEHARLAPEFEAAAALVKAHSRAGIAQTDVP